MNLLARPCEAKHKLGYAVAPESLPADLTGQQCLEIFAMSRTLPEIDSSTQNLIHQLHLTSWMNQRVGEYSLGIRQKLVIVLAMLGNPPLLVFDEVFNGLDPASALTLKRHLAQRVATNECSVILATHALDIVESYCTGARLLFDGRLHAPWGRAELGRICAVRGQLESAMAAALSDGRSSRYQRPS